MVSEFNINDSIKLMLLSTKSSSVGLNLIAANRVVIFEPSWNPCDDQQARRIPGFFASDKKNLHSFTDSSLTIRLSCHFSIDKQIR